MAINKKDYTPTKLKGIKIHKNGVDFLFDFRIEGKRYSGLFKSKENHTPTNRLESAYDALKARKTKIIKEASITADTSATIDDYWERVKKIKQWSPKVESDNQYYYKKYLSEMGAMKVRDVRSSHITDLNIILNEGGLSQRYKKKAFEILIPIFRLAIDDEIVDVSPIKENHIPKRDNSTEKKIVTNAVAKYKRLHKALHTKFEDNPHHLAFFLFGFHGRRLGEVNTLIWSDVELDNNKYIIRAENSKISTDLSFALPEEIKILLVQFKGHSRGSENVFNIKEAKCHYSDIRTKSKIPEFTFHWMRNLAVSALSAVGADVTHLSAMLGHVDGQTLKKYLSLQREESTTVTNDLSFKLLS